MDTETTIYNTKVLSVDQNALATTYTCLDCGNEFTPNHKDLVGCTCGLMSATVSCVVNNKLMVSVKTEKLIKANLITTVGLLLSCYWQHETIKLFAKSILTTPINMCHNNVELKVLSIKNTDKNKN